MIKKLPIPIAGLMLALAATGNLLLSYGTTLRNIFGLMSGIVLILLLIKIIVLPKALKEGFKNPVIASVIPTFTMGLILLSTYIQPYIPNVAFLIWISAIVLHGILIFIFTLKYIVKFNLNKVFPSYFIVYVGIVCASVTAPVFNMVQLGQYIFWFGFISYLILLPMVLYRTLVIKGVPEPAMPTFVIYTAPASLCLAGYLNSFQSKSMVMISFLAFLSLLMFVSVIIKMPKLLKLKFYPSYSAFTFPFVITAIAMKSTKVYLSQKGLIFSFFNYFVNILELWAVIIVVYVLVKYIVFIVTTQKSSPNISPAKI